MLYNKGNMLCRGESLYWQNLIHVKANGEEISTPPEQPFYVKNKGWIKASDRERYDK